MSMLSKRKLFRVIVEYMKKTLSARVLVECASERLLLRTDSLQRYMQPSHGKRKKKKPEQAEVLSRRNNLPVEFVDKLF